MNFSEAFELAPILEIFSTRNFLREGQFVQIAILPKGEVFEKSESGARILFDYAGFDEGVGRVANLAIFNDVTRRNGLE